MQKTTFKSVLSLITLIVLSAFMSIGFQSCSKADDGGDPSESSFVGKWTVSNPSDNGYGSFEFTDDQKYIITQRTTTPPSTRSANTRASETVYIIIIFGDISSLTSSGNEYTLDLKDFGTITIHIDPTKGTATVTDNSGKTYTTKKEKEIVASDKTEKLCHTWKLKIPEEDKDYMFECTVTFSKSGTYFVYRKARDGGYDENGDWDSNLIIEESWYATWEWNNKEQTEFHYHYDYWNDYTGYEVVDGTATISELTDKYMKVEETDEDDGEVHITEHYRD
jgi:hypothetical protein